MKTTIFLLALVLLSCNQEDPKPKSKLVGVWAYETASLSVYFEVVEESGILNIINRRVVNANIPTNEEGNNIIQLIDKTQSGCEVIEIVSRGSVQYSVFMLGNQVQSGGNITVNEMQIIMPNTQPYSLTNQTLVRQ
jgi:hypothetical protein